MKPKLSWLLLVTVIGCVATAPLAWAQRRPYIGYAYPAGGQQATTIHVKIGGQDVDDAEGVVVTGTGVTGRITNVYRRLGPQEIQLLNDQLKALKRGPGAAPSMAMMSADAAMMSIAAQVLPGNPSGGFVGGPELVSRIEKRRAEWVQTPACASIATIVVAEITISPEADAGRRELRIVTGRGVSNPLVFEVGQFVEYTRAPMLTASKQVLGKEALALRKRPGDEVEDRISPPCTVNGQIASGEVNRYRFPASKGQRLVISTRARELVPFVADAVPGWFQPVIALYDAQGRECAFADDYRFKPDPVILYQVPEDGDYVLEIRDSIYRGREDFVYRMTIGELPFVTSVFPLGAQAGTAVTPRLQGWNIDEWDVRGLAADAGIGLHRLSGSALGFRSNEVPFVLEALPDGRDREPNDTVANAQPIALPLVVNGRIDRSDDRDVFRFTGRANETIVAEVEARRLESPLDSVLKLTNEAGRLIAFNDDREDLTSGANTHHADSYLLAKLPADGTYYLHIGDTARSGGSEYGYRLRVSAPQPDFELRAVPSSVNLAVNATGIITVYAQRKDGFTGAIRIALKDPPAGLSASPVTLTGNQTVGRLSLKATAAAKGPPVALAIVGTAKIGDRELSRDAVPAEDRMQAFLWRHLVPANDLQVLVYDRNYQPVAKRPAPPPPPIRETSMAATNGSGAPAAGGAGTTGGADKPKFSKQQIAGRLRQLKLLYEEGLLTDEFYGEKVAECVQ